MVLIECPALPNAWLSFPFAGPVSVALLVQR